MTEAPQPRLLSTSQVARLTGATLRQLQWWDEQGYLRPRKPSGQKCGWGGRRRLYSVDEVGRVRLFTALRANKVPLMRCWGLVDELWPLESGEYVVIPIDNPLARPRRTDAPGALNAAAGENGPVVVIRWK